MANSTQTPVKDKLKLITTRGEREALNTRLHFLPINLSVLELLLKDKLISVSSEEDQKLYEILANQVNLWETEDLLGFENSLTQSEKLSLPEDKLKRKKELKLLYNKKVRLVKENSFNFDNLYKEIVAYIKQKHKNTVYIKGENFVDIKQTVLDPQTLKAISPAVVIENDVIIGAIYSNFSSAGSGIFTPFFNTFVKKFLNTKIYKENKGYSPGFDIGHILGNSQAATTPLAQKCRKILEALKDISNPQATQLKTEVTRIYETLRQQSSYGPIVETTLTKNTQGALKSVDALIVVAQERIENQRIYGSLIEGKYGTELANLIEDMGFSNSIKEDIVLSINEHLRFGKDVTKGTKKTVKFTNDRKPKSLSKNIINSVIKAPGVAKKQLPKAIVKAPLISSSIVNLERILNASLYEKIKKNMGTGSSTSILNYRSGEFARSAKVESLSESREGMITVFYSYMKNPYATFSRGGRQERPFTRDPKTLISKSIRELAAPLVANRMRAVLV